MTDPSCIRVVIPAHNAGWCINACLSGLRSAGFAPDEIVVVDDGSTDATAAQAQGADVRVLSNASSLGAAAARNRGAAAAEGDVLFFVDADVVVHPDVKDRLTDFFTHQTGFDAVFGAYDDSPASPSLTSQYRNLLHHHVHLRGPARPTSFWTGCGAVRRPAFDRLGGFDEGQRMMEDVEFGMRLCQAGGIVALDPNLQGKHLKSWTVLGMMRTDLFDRAIPWTRLMLFGTGLSNELNLDPAHRGSAVLTALIWFGLLLAPVVPWSLLLVALATLGFVVLNRDLLHLVRRAAGLRAALAAVPLHMLHYTCALLGFGWVMATEYLPRRARDAVMTGVFRPRS